MFKLVKSCKKVSSMRKNKKIKIIITIWVTDPKQEESETIWPATLAPLLTSTLQTDCCKDNASNVPRSEVNFAMHSSVASTEPLIVLRTTPSHVIT